MAKQVVVKGKKNKVKKDAPASVIVETTDVNLCNLVTLQGLSLKEARKRLGYE